MRPDSDHDKLMVTIGALLGTGFTVGYVGLLAVLTGVVEYDPWGPTVLVSGETFLVIFGVAYLLVGAVLLHYAPKIGFGDDTDSSTRVDA